MEHSPKGVFASHKVLVPFLTVAFVIASPVEALTTLTDRSPVVGAAAEFAERYTSTELVFAPLGVATTYVVPYPVLVMVNVVALRGSPVKVQDDSPEL